MRRSPLLVLSASAAVGALGLAAGGSAGALLTEQMTGSTALTGLPLGLLVVGSAAGALVISRVTARRGRRVGLMLGYLLGVGGALTVVLAATWQHFSLLLAGSALLGAANAAIFLTRYAAIDLVTPAQRGRALGTVFFATAFGAVASPNLLGPSGDVAAAIGLPRLAGLYGVAVLAFGAAGWVLSTLEPSSRPSSPVMLRSGLKPARRALLLLGGANLVMVSVMAIAPVHLAEHDHGLGFIGVVISVHVLCMFGPSPLTGRLVDKAGTAYVAVLGGMLLAAAGVCGVLLDVANGGSMTVMLALLGLGWNACVIAGSAMLAAATPLELRPAAEGAGEVVMGLAAGAGAPIAGVIVGLGSFTALSGAAIAASGFVILTLGLVGREPEPDAATLSALPS